MKLKYLFLPLLLFVFSSAWAVASPLVMLEKTSNQLLTELDKEKVNIHNNPTKVYSIVDRILLPHVDKIGMSRSALGREAWMGATSTQKDDFIKVFTQLVVQTYASALASYDNETIRFMPIRGGYESKKRVQVESMVIRENGQTIPVTYRLALKGNEWKVYDMSVEGVSLLRNFRSQFSSELSTGTLDELITKLKKHNLTQN